MREAIFLERDGILNLESTDKAQLGAPLLMEQFQVNRDAVEPLARLKGLGYLLIVTTNQPQISLGKLNRGELDRMHNYLRKVIPVDDILVCPHDNSDCCPCRKPKPGLLTEAAFKWHIDLSKSYVISNKWQDAEAARLVGCTSLLVQSPWIGKGHHDFVMPSLNAAVNRICDQPALYCFSYEGALRTSVVGLSG